MYSTNVVLCSNIIVFHTPGPCPWTKTCLPTTKRPTGALQCLKRCDGPCCHHHPPCLSNQVDRFLLSLPLTDSERDCHIEELVARHLYKSSLQWRGTQQQLQQRCVHCISSISISAKPHSLREVHDLQQRLEDAQHDAMSNRRTSPVLSVLSDHNPRCTR